MQCESNGNGFWSKREYFGRFFSFFFTRSLHALCSLSMFRPLLHFIFFSRVYAEPAQKDRTTKQTFNTIFINIFSLWLLRCWGVRAHPLARQPKFICVNDRQSGKCKKRTYEIASNLYIYFICWWCNEMCHVRHFPIFRVRQRRHILNIPYASHPFIYIRKLFKQIKEKVALFLSLVDFLHRAVEYVFNKLLKLFPFSLPFIVCVCKEKQP